MTANTPLSVSRSRKKILYVITKSSWGGAQRYVYDLATRLDPGRFDIAVACGGNGPLVEKLERAGVRAISLPALGRRIRPGRELAALWQLFRLFGRERPGVVHLSSSKAGGLGAVAAFVCKILFPIRHPLSPRIIFTAHGWPFREERPRWQRSLIFVFSWLTSVLADHLIVIDDADYRDARRFVPESKLALIPHGLPAMPFLPAAEARALIAEKIGMPPMTRAPLIGTVAELTANKGLQHLIAAIRRVKFQSKNSESQANPHDRISKFQTVIMGEGELRRTLETNIRASGLAGTVHLAGFMPEAAPCLRGLDVFVLPSLKEGLPYALMEAMAAGLPVVASAVGGIPDLIRPGETGLLVPPADPTALARAISDLIRSPAERERLGRAARERILEQFRIGEMIEKTVAVYESR